MPRAVAIDPATEMGPVALTVADASAASAFYEQAIGLLPLPGTEDGVQLGAGGRAAATSR